MTYERAPIWSEQEKERIEASTNWMIQVVKVVALFLMSDNK